MRFLGKRKRIWFTLSIALFAIAAAALIYYRLPLGIDFQGGAQIEVSLEKQIEEGELREKISQYPGARGVIVTKTGENSFIIRMLPITDAEHQEINKKLQEDFGTVTEKQYQLVGPSVSQDLTRKAIIAVVLAAIMIIIYLAYSFRGVSYPVSSWRFGVIAVIALLHDLLITIGVFAVLAHFFHFEVDASFITALLTVMGFSVHDTIVVFDRVRENLIRGRDGAYDFEQVADESLAQTLNRSLATSLTVIFTLTALVVLGGESIRAFVVTLLVGITVGAYSSIFTATPLLVVWQQRATRRAKRG